MRTSSSLTGKIFAFALGFAILSNTASAGLISGVQTSGGPGMGAVSVPIILTLAPNNDDQTGGGSLDNNITFPFKRFDKPDYIDIEFYVTNTSGTSEYRIIESVDNNTSVNWSGYEMTLGFGTGVGFTPSIPGDGLDFDAPLFTPVPMSSVFSTVGAIGEDKLVFSNGIQGTIAESYEFRVDVPDSLTGQEYSFTLRQIPIAVPEPSSCLVLLGALACMWLYRKHRS